LKMMCDRLQDIDAHPALFLLRQCVGAPRIVYTLRTSFTQEDTGTLGQMDEVLRSSLEKILNVQLNETQWSQSSLPMALGGLGIRKLSDLSMPCFISSSYSSRGLVNVLTPASSETHDAIGSRVLSRFLEHSEIEDELSQSCLVNQHKLDELGTSRVLKSLMNVTVLPEKARLIAACDKESSRWMHAIPSENLRTKLSDSDVRISIALRLGSFITQPHECARCGTAVDEQGRHGLSCRKSAGRHFRHNQLNDVFARALSSAGFPNAREVSGLNRDDGKRPDGVTLAPFARGRPLVWDVTVSDIFAPTNLNTACQKAGATADAAELFKINKYSSLADTYIVKAVAFDTMGVPATDTRKLLKLVGNKLSVVTSEPRAYEYFLQRMSLEMVRSNTICILGTLDDRQSSLSEINHLH
jgi:hypothetical protein